ncbi:MAG TPA: NAD(P)H-dependent oxidoreductase [Polyangiaceae bacterium LLY-WYZ-14_1]|nr:NAD(P)H-dependent oxidoreductase [Polyangiaceae bacterium LLY-WYZ-14_1]
MQRGASCYGPAVPRVLAIAGSPSPTSRTAALVERAATLYQRAAAAEGREGASDVEILRLRDVPPAALVAGATDDPALAASHRAVAEATGVILGTPVYKASYSGLLKIWLDSLDQFALRGKVVLPLAVGGSPAHVLVLDYALRPVLQSFDPRLVTAGYFVQEGDVGRGEDGTVALPARVDRALGELVTRFRAAL